VPKFLFCCQNFHETADCAAATRSRARG